MTPRFQVLRVLLSLCLILFFSAAATSAKKKPPAKPVNINTATSEELQQVPGIGPATAQKILQMRKSYGPFKSVDDLLAIRGLGQKRLDKMRKYLTVGKAAAPKSTQPPANVLPNTPGPEASLVPDQHFELPSSACTLNPFCQGIADLRSARNTQPASIDLWHD